LNTRKTTKTAAFKCWLLLSFSNQSKIESVIMSLYKLCSQSLQKSVKLTLCKLKILLMHPMQNKIRLQTVIISHFRCYEI